MPYNLSCTESQIEHLLIEWSQYNASLDNDESDEESTDNNCLPDNNRQYQLEFVRSMFTEDEIKDKFPHLLATETVSIQNGKDLNRTIADFETKLTPYVIQSSHGGKKFFRDFEAFLESDVVSIKNAPHSHTNYSAKTTKALPPNYTSTPLPLLIEDVLKIDLSGAFNNVRSMFGQTFKKVMIHGISQQTNGRSKGEKKCQNYIVDDGTGSIRVRFNHGTYRNDLLRQVEILRADYFIAKKEGIACADKELLPPHSEKCKKILRDVGIILKCIDRNNRMAHERFSTGVKMFVVGIPFWNEFFKEIQLFAYNIHEDSGINRDMEINFKKHLFRLYETKYVKEMGKQMLCDLPRQSNSACKLF